MKSVKILSTLSLLLFSCLIGNIRGYHVALCFASCNETVGCGTSKALPWITSSLGSGIFDYVAFGNKVKTTVDRDSAWKMTVTAVLNAKKQPLFGWFSIKLDRDNDRPARILAIQGESRHADGIGKGMGKSGVGQFMYPDDIGSSCLPTAFGITSNEFVLGRKNILPCFAIRNPYHLTSSGFIFGSPSSPPYLESITLLYRLDFPVCSAFSTERNLKFRTYLLTTDNKEFTKVDTPLIYVKDWTYGASDPLPPKQASSPLDCSSSDISTASWIDRVEQNQKYGLEDNEKFCRPDDNSMPNNLFYGRCENAQHEVGAGDARYVCDEGNDFYDNLEEYGDVIKASRDNCRKVCVDIWNATIINGYSANSKVGREIWSLRQSHGLAMAVLTLFILPVSFFVSRYFKETNMSTKIAHLPVWYAVHSHMSLAALGVLFAGMISGIWARSIFGFSLLWAGRVHVILGWSAAFTFAVVFLSSPFRCKAVTPRLCCIFLHFLLGVLNYGLCMTAMISSWFIPGSPSTYKDYLMGYVSFEIQPFSTLVLARIIFDIVFHIVMMILMKVSDKKMGQKGSRRYVFGLVPIPIFDMSSQYDTPGACCRSIMLKIYIVISLVLTVMFAVRIVNNSTEGRLLGPTSYTHKANGKLKQANKLTAYTY